MELEATPAKAVSVAELTLAEVVRASRMSGVDVSIMLGVLLKFDGEAVDLAQRVRHGVVERFNEGFQIA